METAFAVVAVVACIALVIALARLAVLKKGITEIRENYNLALKGGTDARITVFSSDRTLISLADSLNKDIVLLREKELKYLQGDRELKEAIANVSHDLRTPLTAICGYLDLAKEESDKQKADKYLEIVRERAVALKNLTEELFAYTLTCGDSNAQKSEVVSIGAVLEDTLLGFYDVMSQKGITPVTDISSNTFECIADKSALVRIFENVISNALKHGDGDIEVKLCEDGSVEFSNCASKLNAVDVERLFDRFFTVENGRRSTGLGLSIAKNLTRSLGGEISAKLSGGRLTVKVTIPCKKKR